MSSSLQLVFCGTPAFAVPTLERLAQAGFSVQLVVTQPDRPKGRGMELAASPVKESALKLGLPIVQPGKIKNNEEFHGQLTSCNPDAIIVVGYGRIVPQWMLDLPRLGNINLHASLLPKYRGAAPIQWAIANGENASGVTTMRIDAGLDTGDILLQQEEPIALHDTSETLAPRLAAIGAELMLETLKRLQAGTIQPRKQDDSRATLAPILTKEDGRIDFRRSASQIFNRMRGFQPWPGAFTMFRGRNLHIWNADVRPQSSPSAQGLQEHGPQLPRPGEIRLENSNLVIGCGEQSLLFPLEVQPEGKKRMPVRDFVHGYRPESGEMLG